jgi:hypothetical protein
MLPFLPLAPPDAALVCGVNQFLSPRGAGLAAADADALTTHAIV